jgi:hypothetical protein
MTNQRAQRKKQGRKKTGTGTVLFCERKKRDGDYFILPLEDGGAANCGQPLGRVYEMSRRRDVTSANDVTPDFGTLRLRNGFSEKALHDAAIF